jgi:hypothetical protein
VAATKESEMTKEEWLEREERITRLQRRLREAEENGWHDAALELLQALEDLESEQAPSRV